MRTILLILTAVSCAFSADPAKSENPWNKVKELRSGSEVRIYKHGATRPLTVKLAEATDDKLIYAVKNSQGSIDRNDIDRIDYRPSAKSEKTETRAVTMDGSGSSDTWSSGTSWTRSGWQTVYRKALP